MPAPPPIEAPANDGNDARRPTGESILLAMPLPEAQSLREALRAQGLRVIERPATELGQHGVGPLDSLEGETSPGPVSSHGEPRVLVMDLGDPAAGALLQILRPLPGTGPGQRGGERPEETRRSGPVIVAVGSAAVATELGLRPEDAVFDRPLDVGAVSRFVLGAVTPRGTLRPSAPPPPSERSAFKAAAERFAEDFPGIPGLGDADALLGSLGLDSLGRGQAHAELGADIEQLLESAAARARVDKQRQPATRLDERDPVLVPQDAMGSLEELLRADDEAAHDGSSGEPAAASSSVISSAAPGSASLPGAEAHASDGRVAAGITEAGLAPARPVAPPKPVPPATPGTGAGIDSAPATSERGSVSSWPPEPTRAAPSTWPPMPLGGLGAMPSPRIATVAPRTIAMPDHVSSARLEPARAPTTPRRTAALEPVAGSARYPESSLLAAASARLEAASGRLESASVASDDTPSAPATTLHGPPSNLEQSAPAPRRLASSLPPPRTSADGALGVARASGSGTPIASERQPLVALARAIAARSTGALRLETAAPAAGPTAVRWIVLRDGDMVTAASELPEEGLVRFLVERGDLDAEVAELHGDRLPHAGRHAAAALIAHGFLAQDELWPALRAHAEWIIARALRDEDAEAVPESGLPERLRAEPSVFGGAAGVEVFIEAVRRVWSPEQAIRRLGGGRTKLGPGPNLALLAESALAGPDVDAIRGLRGARLSDTLGRLGGEIAPVLLALAALAVIECRSTTAERGADDRASEAPFDPLDAEAVRERVRVRIGLVREGDYFSLLGISPEATEYEIRRAYVELRRAFEPARLLTAATADLGDDVRLIVEVLEESYEILRDPHRRSRYRKALLGGGG